MERAVIVSDWQIPYEDPAAVRALMQYIGSRPPDLIVVLGDFWDFPQLTTKFVRRHTEPGSLEADLLRGREYLIEMQTLALGAPIIFIEGNHEERLRRYIEEQAPAIRDFLDTGGPLDLPTLIDPEDKVGMEYYGPYGEAWTYLSFVFKHGDHTGPYAAHKELVAEGSSGMSGHTHRFEVAARTDRGGAHAWYSIGCMCYTKGLRMPPGTVEGRNRVRDWQQGFAEVVWDEGIFNVYPIIITSGSFIGPDGERYGG